MKKSELKNGSITVTRNKMVWLKIDNTLLSLAMNGIFITLDGYTEDLKDKNGVIEYDIVKVYNDVENTVFNACNKGVSEYKYGVPTWERIEILDYKEKEYLSQVIKPFRYRVTTINKTKHSVSNKEYIKIVVKNGRYYDYINLPDFKANTMYKGMESDKNYTLEELEI